MVVQTDEKWAEKREQEEEVKIAELAAKMAEERQNVVAEEVEKKAASMLEEKEKEIAEKRKKFVRHLWIFRYISLTLDALLSVYIG